ncbi:hypothetical protein [Glycomyces paridis]|uniref:Uncharacterized protein n=1 Tax=Glycomyces paridis TaxID=2126555 RepID=A0A4S8PI06_9ACTN|nr:hypothetical protein [Glycomyces paridis]THV27964.1 hypothetical protein E9998_13320 [Glycomyces paridis]
MSSDTAAQPQETAASPAAPSVSPASATGSGRGVRGARPRRPGRGWALLTAAAALAFCGALVFGALRLLPDVAEVADSPEHTVEAFLAALLDERDAEASAAWLCADKADRDLAGALERMAAAEGPGAFAWGEVTETARSVGAATVTAEIRVDPGGGAALSDPATWVFSLVAEAGEPQWLICGVAAQ